MSKIYKYASIDSGIKILNSESILLNSPQNYNDPFDSIIDFDNTKSDKIIKIIIEFYLTQECLKILNNEAIKANFFVRPFIKWDKFAINLLLMLNCKNCYYSSIPFIQCLVKFIQKKYSSKFNAYNFKQVNEKHISDLVEKIKTIRNMTLVSCFSKRNDSILMWSHYGNSHCGVCIEYDRPLDSFFDINYSKYRKSFDLEDTTRRVLAYMINNKEVNLNDIKLIQNIMTPFLTKSNDWKYEDEVRCIIKNESDNVYISENNTFLKMPLPTAIYIGCKAKNNDIKGIVELAKKKNIKIYFMKEDIYQYKLNFKEGIPNE